LEKEADFLYKEVICWFGTLESLMVEGGAENKKWTDHLLKRYNSRNITVPPYNPAANGVIE
jgi:hypothetical protein